MCGIAGILNLDGRPARRDVVEAMGLALAHRGPDGAGAIVDGPVALAHRRLSIIDLSPAASQPMAGPGQTWITYNGEIYNFRELRARLEATGDHFRSKSDTEVVLHLYAREGLDAVGRLNGIFAFGLWDAARRRLVLATDRFGTKPIYYRREANRLLFGSEIKALVAAGVTAQICADAVHEYFTFQNVFSDLTLFDGVRILKPGHLLVADDHGIEIRNYWDLVFAPEERDEAWHAARVREAFEAAVTRQLVSDVPVGCYLSGGMDSTSIAAVARARLGRLPTFTVGFDPASVSGLELAFDERADAAAAAANLGTEHHETVLHSGDMAAVLPELVWHLEDLRVGMSYQNYCAARLARRDVTVVLAGVGGDEIFAGYPWRYGAVLDCPDEAAFENTYYHAWNRLVPAADVEGAFTASFGHRLDRERPREVFRGVLAPAKGWHPLDKALYVDARTFLHGLLVVEDRLSMAHGLESRVPFLDDDLVAVAAAVPVRYKLSKTAGKAILRRALPDLLPAATLAKPKQGFSPPDRSWYQGPTMQYVRDVVLGPRALSRGYFESAFLCRVVDEHVSGLVNHRLLLWSLLCFEWWNRLFLDGEPVVRGQA